MKMKKEIKKSEVMEKGFYMKRSYTACCVFKYDYLIKRDNYSNFN